MIAEVLRPTPLELAAGQVLRPGRLVSLPELERVPSPLEALEDAIRPALQREPCFVGFSGGRDSSAVLAVAAQLASREGLRPPVPVTMRFRGRESADESASQHEIVQSLGLPYWLRLEFGDELHALGPVAMGVVRRHGVVWPANAYLHVPLFEAARGGSLLTGVGGEEILGGVRWRRTADVVAREARPRFRDARGVGLAYSPLAFRRVVARASLRDFGPWLRRRARRRAVAWLAAHAAAEPFAWRDRLRWWLGAPHVQAGTATLRLLAADAGVVVLHPLLDRGFVAALASLPPERRWTRAKAMQALFGDVLPEAAVRRAAKGSLDHIMDPGPRLELLERWRGEAVDDELVDPERLRAVWSAAQLDPSALPLLQHVKLVLDGGPAPIQESAIAEVIRTRAASLPGLGGG
jgi:asparagine synthase (glutamine-hydrolysing)